MTMAKKIRQPGGTRTIDMTDSEEDEDAQNLAVGPLQQFISNIAKIQKGVKRKAILTSNRHPLHKT